MKENQETTEKTNMELAILNAAEELFVEKGFRGTSTIEIAAKAGCNQALVHYYYRTKANLFFKILKSKIIHMVSMFDYIDNDKLSFKENLTKTIENHFDALVRDKRLPMFVLNEIKNNHDVVHIIRDIFNNNTSVMLGKLDRILEKEIKAKRIREITAFDLVITITSLNIFVFLAYPIVDYILNLDEEGVNTLVQQRKKDIINTVLSSLRPL